MDFFFVCFWVLGVWWRATLACSRRSQRWYDAEAWHTVPALRKDEWERFFLKRFFIKMTQMWGFQAAGLWYMVSHQCMRHHLSQSFSLKTSYLIHFYETPFQETTRQIHYQEPRQTCSGCKIRRVDEKMKCSKTCQNELKTCQNECEYYSESESASEMPWELCFIRVLMILGLFFCISIPLILLPVYGVCVCSLSDWIAIAMVITLFYKRLTSIL